MAGAKYAVSMLESEAGIRIEGGLTVAIRRNNQAKVHQTTKKDLP